MQELQQIGQLGVAGLAVFLFYKIVGNHINHNTQATEKLVEAVNKLVLFLENKL